MYTYKIHWHIHVYIYLSEATEHPPHRLVVQTFRAVDHNHIHPQTLPQVLHCLCLPRACRTLWTASSMQM